MFYDQLEVLCKKNNISVFKVAKQLSMSTGTVAKWKNGVIPTGETILKLADYFNVSTDYLLKGSLSTSDLENEEIELLQLFRALPVSGKERVIGYIDGYIDAQKMTPK